MYIKKKKRTCCVHIRSKKRVPCGRSERRERGFAKAVHIILQRVPQLLHLVLGEGEGGRWRCDDKRGQPKEEHEACVCERVCVYVCMCVPYPKRNELFKGGVVMTREVSQRKSMKPVCMCVCCVFAKGEMALSNLLALHQHTFSHILSLSHCHT